MVKKILSLVLLSASFYVNAQSFGIEANYGLNGSYDPSYNGFTHFGAGVTYDFNETFGAKIDFGSDKFEIENTERALLNNEPGLKTGTQNTRITLQGVVNLSNLADDRAFYNKFNILAHAGGGLSILKSDIKDYPNTDHLFNVVLGVTPRYQVAENFFVTLDASALFNVSQHYLFNGELAYTQAPNSFTGLMYNVSFGLAYKFGSR